MIFGYSIIYKNNGSKAINVDLSNVYMNKKTTSAKISQTVNENINVMNFTT